MGTMDVVDIQFPAGGLSRQLAYQSWEGPFTTPSCQNVRPFDTIEGRLRGGSRPGTQKLFSDLLGSGNPIRLLNSVQTGQELAQASSYEDAFSGSALASDWALWNQTNTPSDTPSLPTVSGGVAHLDGSASNDEHVGAILTTPSYNANGTIAIESKLWTSDGMSNLTGTSNTVGQRWALAMGLTGATNYTGGVVVSWFNSAAGSALDVAVYNQGSTLFTSSGFVSSGNVVKVEFIPGGTLNIYMGSASNLVATVTGVTLSGTQVAFQAWHSSGASRDAGFEYFNFTYTAAAAATPIAEPALVASSNGALYYEDSNGSLAEVTGQNVDLASDRLLSSAERFGKLYIADYEVRVEGTDGVISSNGTAFDSATAGDWSALGIDMDGDMIELMSGGSVTGEAYIPNAYAISSLNGGANLTITDCITTGAGSATAVPYRVIRALKVFDYRLSGTSKLTKLTATGTTAVPLGCTIVCVWNDRLCLSGDPENPGDTFMSEQGDPTNWDEDTNATSPIFGEFDTNTRINEPVTALIPFTRDYLVIGGLSTINVVRGNPIINGTVDSISRTVGIVGKAAYCVTPDGFLVVMTGDGLYVIDPSASTAVPLSRDRLPREFIGLDNVNNDIQLEFDARRNGVKIAVTPQTASDGTYYWFDWTTKTFWPESYPVGQRPTAMTSYVPSGQTTSKLVLGCADGYTRCYEDSAEDDDGTNFASHVLIGALNLGGGGYFDGMVRECKGQLAVQSGTVTAEIQIGDSIESAYNATPRSAYTLRAGRGLSWHPRLRGNAAFIKLSSAGGSRWAYENLSVVRERLGKQRLLA